MEIPAVFLTKRRRGLAAAAPEGCLPPAYPALLPFEEVQPRLRSPGRDPVVAVDWDSVSSSRFREGVVKALRIRGREPWLLTWVRNAGDLMDSFNTTAEMVLAPLHAIDSRADLEDIVSISDGTVPAVFCEGGEAVLRDGEAGVVETLAEMEAAGFPFSCVLDADSGLSGDDWEAVFDAFPSCVPFTCDTAKVGMFGRRIAPLRLRRARR